MLSHVDSLLFVLDIYDYISESVTTMHNLHQWEDKVGFHLQNETLLKQVQLLHINILTV